MMQQKTDSYRYLLYCFALLGFVVLLGKPSFAGTKVKVGILPFFIHSKDNIGYLGRAIPAMLSTRIEKWGDIAAIEKPVVEKVLKNFDWERWSEEKARKIGIKTGADFVVGGSLTKIGKVFSLDVSLIDISGKKATQKIYASSEDLAKIPVKLLEVARQLDLIILDKKIVSKVIISGNRFIEKDAVLFAIRTKPGDVFSPEVLQDDLKRIFQLGYFKDIRITSVDADGGKEITFHVKERPVVRAIQINGNKKVKLEDIQKVMEVKPRTILDLNKVTGDVARIKKIYVGKGYYNADVSYKVTPVDDSYAAVDFYIKENKIVKVEKITFSGNNSIPAKKLKKIMETRQKSWLSLFTSIGVFKDEALEKDLQRITAYYYSKGFLQVKVEKPRVEFKKDGIYIHFNIIEGNRYVLGGVDFKGDLIFDTSVLRSKLKSAPGEVFNGRTLNDDLIKLKALYAEQGYAFADISPLTDLQAEDRKVDLVFDIDKGEKIYIEKISIIGNTRTRDNVIRREMRLTEGEIYNSEEIKRSKQEINNLGYFKEVNINAEPGTASNQVQLNIEVEERPTGSFSVGAGYSSVDSVVGMFQISQNNLFGKGQRLNLMAQLGGRSNLFNVSFTEPWFRDTRTSVGFDLYNIERRYEDFDSNSSGFNLRTSFPLSNHDFTRFHLTYRYEAVDIDVNDDDVALEIQKQDGKNTTSSVTASIIKDSRDDRWKPRRGVYNRASLEFAGLGGDSQFVAMFLSLAKFFPLPWDTAFMVRGTIGQLFKYSGKDIPISEKYFLGGLYSLRGFEVRSVGPRERRPKKVVNYEYFRKKYKYRPSGKRNKWDVIGGEKQLFFNFEYVFPIMKEAGVRGVVFFDTGNAYDEGETFFSNLRYDVGLGVRWYSPFGPLRLEWGYNLSPEYDEDTSNFEFSMGRTF